MSVDFLSKNFPPFQVHHAKKPPRFYPDGFQRNVIDFYFIFSDCRLRKALYLQFSYFIWPLCAKQQLGRYPFCTPSTLKHTYILQNKLIIHFNISSNRLPAKEIIVILFVSIRILEYTSPPIFHFSQRNLHFGQTFFCFVTDRSIMSAYYKFCRRWTL